MVIHFNPSVCQMVQSNGIQRDDNEKSDNQCVSNFNSICKHQLEGLHEEMATGASRAEGKCLVCSNTKNAIIPRTFASGCVERTMYTYNATVIKPYGW